MKNIETKKDGNKLVITIDLTVKGVPSKSGKSIVIASTEGNQQIEGVYVGVNVYKKV